MKKYKYNGPGLSISASKTAQILGNIHKKYGELTTEILLKEFQKKSCPLHKDIEWNDTVAANKYRLEQIRHIIKGLMIIDEQTKKLHRAFVHIRRDENNELTLNPFKGTNENNSFLSFDTVMNNPETRNHMLLRAFAELKNFKLKYSTLKELTNIIEEINKLI